MSQYEIVSTETTNSRLRLPKALYVGIIQYEHIILKINKGLKTISCKKGREKLNYREIKVPSNASVSHHKVLKC